jgi:uncharacterized protein (DUF58 family)
MTFIIMVAIATILTFCVMMYYSNAAWTLKALSFSLLMLAGVSTYLHYRETLSAPVYGKPPAEFIYVHHIITPDNQIVLWTDSTVKERHRLYVFPYNREEAKKLSEAQGRSQNGEKVQGEFKTDQHAPGITLDTWQGPVDVSPKIHN